MADISKVNLPDGSSFDVKDAIARSTKADRVPAPAEYDPTVTYHEGDICTHNGNVYYCHSSTTTGSWDSNKWRLLTTPQQDYLHSIDPVGVGSFSLNRKVGTNVGKFSFAEGQENTANGMASHAEGNETIASGRCAHAEGVGANASGAWSHAEGNYSYASGTLSHAEGDRTTASGYSSHAEGFNTIANHLSQHVFGAFNIADTSTASASSRGNYIEIVGNGADVNARSNARTLDWNGNEVLAGGLKINGTQNVATQVSLTQAEYDALVQAGTVDLVNTVYFITDGNANANSASETTYDNTSSGLSATNVQGAIDELESGKANTSDLATVATSGSYTDLSNKPDTKSFMRCAYWTSESKTTYVLNYDYLAGISTRPYGMAIVAAWKDIFALHYNSDTSIFIVKMTNSSDRTATCAWDSTNRTITLTFSGTIWSGISVYPM